MSRYVPPHLRNKCAEGGGADADRGDDRREQTGRFDDLRNDDRRGGDRRGDNQPSDDRRVHDDRRRDDDRRRGDPRGDDRRGDDRRGGRSRNEDDSSDVREDRRDDNRRGNDSRGEGRRGDDRRGGGDDLRGGDEVRRDDRDRHDDDRRGGGDDRRGGGRGGGGGPGGDGGGKCAVWESSGGDWYQRQDGRRRGQEPSELDTFGPPKEKSSIGIDFDKYDAIPVQLTGTKIDIIKPIARFSEAQLSDSLFGNLKRCGYERPTPVQKHSIPIVISGRDLMACAQTGSGKTCAFMVPCLESLLRSGPPAAGGGRRLAKPCALVLAPTRELAAQIHVEAAKFAWHTGILCCIIYGGADMREQRGELERGCDILVATPGRLTDMCERKMVSLELIQFFILDEADRMLDMGFEPQVREIVERTGMGKNSKFPRQSMMFSATFAREVQRMAQDFLNDYVFITVGRVGSAAESVRQHVVYAGELKQKVRELGKAIKEHLTPEGLAVVFVETKRSADSLELDLHEQGVPAAAIHGDRSQQEREEALAAFKSGANPVLVATDVAARGLDIQNVVLVVNFDMPKQLDDYVHRIGRTGRAGRKGTAVAFVNERCGYLHELGDLLVEAKQEPPMWFNDLCRSAQRSGGKGGGKGGRNFGGQDLRLTDPTLEGSGSKATTGPPPRQNVPVNRPSDSWGNSGEDDAW